MKTRGELAGWYAYAAVCVGMLALPLSARAALAPEDLARVRAAEAARIETIEKVRGAVVAVFGPNAGRGGGSGVLFHPDGFALTNYHVVRAAGRKGKGGLADGKLYEWELYGMDPGGDIALIRLDGQDRFPAARIGDSRRVRPGQWALAMGNPFMLAEDYTPTVTLGVISGVERYQAGQSGGMLVYGNCLQIDTSINPGNSGGPLFDGAGRIIGINGRGSFEERGRVNVGVGYAVSTDQILNFLPDLLATRLCLHATLDAVFIEVRDRVICSELKLASPVARAGMKLGDELVAFGGVPIRSANHYLNLVTTLPAGWPVSVTFRPKGGEAKTVWVRLSPLPYGGRAPRETEPEPEQKEDEDKPGDETEEDAPRDEGEDAPGNEEKTQAPRRRLVPGGIIHPKLNRDECGRLLARYVRFLGGREALAGGPPFECEDMDPALARAMAALVSETPLETFAEIELEGGDRAAGERALRLRVALEGDPAQLFWFRVLGPDGDFEGRLLKAAPDSPAKGADGAWVFADWRDEGGRRVPRVRRRVQGLAEETIEESEALEVPPHPVAATFDDVRRRCVKLYGAGAGREHGYATGMIVSPDGHILTARGIYLVGTRLRVVTADGARHEAQVVRQSDRLQAALLKIDVPTPRYFDLDASSSTEPPGRGAWVLAFGNPYNVAGPEEPLSVALGVVSVRSETEARHRTQDVPYEGEILLIDAITSNPGAQGGPLCTLDGRPVGMVGKLFQSTNTNTRINYAVPVELLVPFVRGEEEPGPHVASEPEPEAPELGIRLFTLGGTRGPAYVDHVLPGSPAAGADLRPDDLILAVAGKVVRSCREFDEAAAALPSEGEVRFLVKRGREVLTVTLRLVASVEEKTP